ncbi:hypothetical protein [Aestuariispira insulae]|uniref:Uncharacterized protein n=1 Tax=Aestuariispira insulae TaxID=1461337 RepID=A0A3D9H2K4_9PROT|nr:hypothetical protein [Aestuariispira insulae]RED43710.1 hypothetical protein DFP90_12121 [Aestuariispira insulae]
MTGIDRTFPGPEQRAAETAAKTTAGTTAGTTGRAQELEPSPAPAPNLSIGNAVRLQRPNMGRLHPMGTDVRKYTLNYLSLAEKSQLAGQLAWEAREADAQNLGTLSAYHSRMTDVHVRVFLNHTRIGDPRRNSPEFKSERAYVTDVANLAAGKFMSGRGADYCYMAAGLRHQAENTISDTSRLSIGNFRSAFPLPPLGLRVSQDVLDLYAGIVQSGHEPRDQLVQVFRADCKSLANVRSDSSQQKIQHLQQSHRRLDFMVQNLAARGESHDELVAMRDFLGEKLRAAGG